MKTSKLFLFLILLCVGLSSCKDDTKDYTFYTKGYVKVDRSSLQLRTGQTATLTPSFYSDEVRERGYTWVSENPEIVQIQANEDLSVTLTALTEGKTNVKIVANNDEISAVCEVVVSNSDGIIRVLGIGNSFTEDATQNYLHELATAAGLQVVIAHLYIGGTSLENHLNNATNNSPYYEYRKINEEGVYTNTTGRTMAEVVAAERWDYISFQQQSALSGIFSSYQASLPGLVEYVKSHTTNPNVSFMMHQTWAYAQNYTGAGFANYNNNQMQMYNAIVDAVSQAARLVNINIQIPVGTAIQNGRTSIIGDYFCRDGFHLDLSIGRFTAACTWFEEIFGINVVNNSFKPNGMSDYNAEIAKHAAHFAVLTPDRVTEMVDYQEGEQQGESITYPIYVDFGGWCDDESLKTWNEFKSFIGGSMDNLKDEQSNRTNVSIAVTKRFKAISWTGGGNPTLTDWTIPHYSVAYDGFYGSTADEGTSELIISGLNKDQNISVSLYASYFETSYDPGPQSTTADNRETSFTVKGATESTLVVNASNNLTDVAKFNLKSDAGGKVVITVKKGNNNTTTDGLFYLNALRIAPEN